MKSFVAARCARRQLEVEAGSSSRIAELEEKVSTLQKEKNDLEASLASVRIRVETSIKQLDEACGRAKDAEDTAKAAKDVLLPTASCCQRSPPPSKRDA